MENQNFMTIYVKAIYDTYTAPERRIPLEVKPYFTLDDLHRLIFVAEGNKIIKAIRDSSLFLELDLI